MATEAKKPLHLLVVENDRHDADLFGVGVAQSGIPVRVTAAEDCESALRMLDEHGSLDDTERPDIVILALELPRMTGFAVLEHIKRSEQLRPLPVLMFSASRLATDIDRSYREGAACHICKPSNEAQYLAVVNDLVDYWSRTVLIPKAGVGSGSSRGG